MRDILDIQDDIERLPKGTINVKKINGKEYYYHRWMSRGKRIERIVHKEDLEQLRLQIYRRKQLEDELTQVLHSSPTIVKEPEPISHDFNTNVLIGEDLKKTCQLVKDTKKREIYNQLNDYIYGEDTNKVFVLYGLRRTGKSMMIRQCIQDMSSYKLIRTAYIQITKGITLSDVYKDLDYLSKNGFKYFFIDEITLCDDFIDCSNLFSDVYASRGLKIVLSGTDSLGFYFSRSNALYDRCILSHTTWIPYRDFENVLDIKDIDQYIQYGGTLTLTTDYNNTIFNDNSSTNAYINSAIASNIQHSLPLYENGKYLGSLLDLYEANELTNAINRVIEDINHRFTLSVLTRDFVSHDLAISNKNLSNDRNKPDRILSTIDTDKVTADLMKALEIKNKEDLNIEIKEASIKRIHEYLKLMDVIDTIEVRNYEEASIEERILITQPGLRYSQAEALIQSLKKDSLISSLSLEHRKYIFERITSEIKGRMMEDIILLETKNSFKDKEVFVLRFLNGEYDMVVFDSVNSCCNIYEIKHSDQIVKDQYRHLIDKEKNKKCEYRYGTIKNRIVLYRGKTKKVNDIQYKNVEEYLRELK